MFKQDILSKDEEIMYRNFLKKCAFASCQNCLEWLKVIYCCGTDFPYIIVAKKKDEIVGALPLYYYRCKFGNLLTTIAWHTNASILCSNNVNQSEIYKALLDYSLDLAKELDCAALSINTNPFLQDKEYYLKYLDPDYLMENFIQYVKIDEIFGTQDNVKHPNYIRRTNLHRNLEKASRQQLMISSHNTEANVCEFYKIHRKRMKELNATPFPKKFFLSISKSLIPSGRGRFLFAFYQGRIVACCLFLSYGTIMDVYALSMDSKYNKLRTNYLLTSYMLKWARQNSIAILNWMSSSRREDGVYRWKKQWGSYEQKFFYLTKILGDISQWRCTSYDELSETYKFHYLLPFNLLKKSSSNFTTKDELSLFLLNSEYTQSKSLISRK